MQYCNNSKAIKEKEKHVLGFQNYHKHVLGFQIIFYMNISITHVNPGRFMLISSLS